MVRLELTPAMVAQRLLEVGSCVCGLGVCVCESAASPGRHPIAGAIRTEVIVDFVPSDDAEAGQLSLSMGDIVYVLERHESGWWGGHKEGDDLTGWFPSSALRRADDQPIRDLERDLPSGDRLEVKQLRDELGTKEGRISELEEKVKSLEALLVVNPRLPDVDADKDRQPEQSLSRRLFERDSSAVPLVPISAVPVAGPRSSPRSSASQPPKSSPSSTQLGQAGQPPRPRNDSARRANTPKQIAAPWRSREESAGRPLAVRALVSEFERRSTSQTPGASRHADTTPRHRCGPPSSRNASATRAAVVTQAAVAVPEQAEQQSRGRPVEAKAQDEARHALGCAEERSSTPVIFGMSPMVRSERSAARGLASPAQGLTVQDRIRQLYGGA